MIAACTADWPVHFKSHVSILDALTPYLSNFPPPVVNTVPTGCLCSVDHSIGM